MSDAKFDFGKDKVASLELSWSLDGNIIPTSKEEDC